MKILAIGDVVGSPGRSLLTQHLDAYRKKNDIDFVVCNGENAAGGSGITGKIYRSLIHNGCDVITCGDHTYRNKEIVSCIDADFFVRPANFSPLATGKGWVMAECNDKKIAVINLIGRVFMQPAENPFICVDALLKEIGDTADIIIVDMHCEATSEKIAMGHHLDGRATAVFGTHTHVQTSDARIFPKGTAHITDVGMTGPRHGVIGRCHEPVLYKFLTEMPAKFDVAKEDLVMEGAIITIDDETNCATDIQAIRVMEADFPAAVTSPPPAED